MDYSHNLLVADDVVADDEIDMLFSQLEHIAPPATLVENILASVARLSLPEMPAQRPTQKLWESYGLVTYYPENDPA